MRLADVVWGRAFVFADRQKAFVQDKNGRQFSIWLFENGAGAKYGSWCMLGDMPKEGTFYHSDLEFACWLADKVPACVSPI